MKTLVIHPADRSTDFLKLIYEGKGYTVVSDRNVLFHRKMVTDLIKSHDRIIMLGHGCPDGLFYTVIDRGMVYLLREKECVCIWCNADKFVLKYKLKGFFTGMFISEVGEAFYCGIKASQEEIDYSNNLFATELAKAIDDELVHRLIKESYIGESSVIQYNNARLYYRDDESLLAEKDIEPEFDIQGEVKMSDFDDEELLID